MEGPRRGDPQMVAADLGVGLAAADLPPPLARLIDRSDLANFDDLLMSALAKLGRAVADLGALRATVRTAPSLGLCRRSHSFVTDVSSFMEPLSARSLK